MNVSRNYAKLIKMTKADESYSSIPPSESISVMWELTDEIWSLNRAQYVEQRLQRNITNLYRK